MILPNFPENCMKLKEFGLRVGGGSIAPPSGPLMTSCSAIHKAAGLTVHGRSTGLPGIIPKISKEATMQKALQTPFCTAAGRTAAL